MSCFLVIVTRSDDIMFDRRNWGARGLMLAAVVGGGAVILAARLALGRLQPADGGTVHVLLPTAAPAVAIAWAYAFAVLAFRRLDEFQQEGAKFAWYWGGSAGLALSSVAYAFIGNGGLAWLNGHLGGAPLDGLKVGYLLGVGGPAIGSIIARLCWQAAKR
jgi:hypothetical protein